MLPLNLVMFSIIFLGQGGKSAVNVDPITCQDKLEDFPSIIEDVMNMANWAYERTLGTYDAELPIPDMRVTLSAVTVYFASPSDEELIFLTGALEALSNIASTLPVTIFCNDDFWEMSPTYMDGDPVISRGIQLRVPLNTGGYYWNKKNADPRCDGRVREAHAYTIDEIGWIVICPDIFDTFPATRVNEINTDHVNTDPSGPMTFIDDMVLGHYEEDDINFDNVENNDEYYGFEGCIPLARTHPELAIRNPDSFTLYAMSLYYRMNDWSSGWANEYPTK